MVFGHGRADDPARAEEAAKIRKMHRDTTTGLVLAGGAGQRFGGEDKGLQVLRGRPLVDHVLERLSPQVAQVLISANRNAAAYARPGVRVLADHPLPEPADAAAQACADAPVPGAQGPLGGLLAAWDVLPGGTAASDWIALCPVDAPLLHPQWVARLLAARRADDMAVVCTTEAGPEPLFALVHRSTQPVLAQRLAAGQRAAQGFWQAVGARRLDCSDIAESFANVNAPQALAEMEARLAARPAQSD
jgi:molybdopterin-guanine dinucleotide biosynthesis protein A